MAGKSYQRRNEIATAAIRLFLRQGVQGTSIRDIAEAIGTSAPNLYNYFRSKDEIIDLVAEIGVASVSTIRDYYRSLGNVSPTEALRKCIMRMILDADHDRIVFFNREYRSLSPARASELMETVRQYINFFEHLVDEGIRAGEFLEQDAKLVAFNIYISQQEWALRRWLLRGAMTGEQFAERQADFILRSICVANQAVTGKVGSQSTGG